MATSFSAILFLACEGELGSFNCAIAEGKINGGYFVGVLVLLRIVSVSLIPSRKVEDGIRMVVVSGQESGLGLRLRQMEC